MPRVILTLCLLLAAAVSGAGLFAAPLGTSPAWTVEGDAMLRSLGASVAIGDINGDGYADVLASSGSNMPDGRVFVFFGGIAGPSVRPSQILTSPNAGFGTVVAYLGDWNGDGFGDVAISSNFNEVQMVEVRLGSPAGVAASPRWSTRRDCCAFGQSLAAAGDVNHDGFADLLVGNYSGDAPGRPNAGRAYLFFGGRFASTTPAWTQDGDVAEGYYAAEIGGAGDVNRDGFADIVVSQPGFYDPQENRSGKVAVYMGSASGPAANPVWTTTGPDHSGIYGGSVGPAGDVNGDGFADLAVGNSQANVDVEPGTAGTGQNRGKVYVYHGSSAGLEPNPSWTLTGGHDLDLLGDGLASGDINHDGYSDLIVSAPQPYSINPRPGLVSLYLGSRSGLRETAAWSVSGGQIGAGGAGFRLAVGDVNASQRGDLLVGAPGWEGAAGQGTGRAALYLEGCDDRDPSTDPAAELCDGIDDNCDGRIDEGFGVGQSCTAIVDACHQVVGVQVCDADGTGTSCSGPRTPHDVTPPVLGLPARLVIDATMPSGAAVVYSASAADVCAGPVAVACSPSPGSIFPINAPGQVTTVSCAAADPKGNTASGGFEVHVAGAGEQLAALSLRIENGPLPDEMVTRVQRNIADILAAISDGKTGQACGRMQGLVEELRAFSTRQTPNVPVDEARVLLDAATRIRAVLGC